MRLKIIHIVTFVLTTLSISGQSPRFDSFKILKNKKDVQVYTIYQDHLGFIWLGTNYGLAKYDGIDFELFTTEDSLAENSVTAITQDNENTLWIGHKSGKITLYNNGLFTQFDPEEGLGLEPISSFFNENSGIIWFSTFGEGVYYYAGENRKRLYNLNIDDGLSDNYVYSIVQDDSGKIYFGTDKGISIYNPDTKSFVDNISMSDGLPDNIVKHLIIKGNTLWIAMEDGGICSYDIRNGKFDFISNWPYGSISDFICNTDNELWVSTKENGVVKLNFNKLISVKYKLYGIRNGLPDIHTNTIFLDREGNVWIGLQRGLTIRKNNNFEFLSEKDGFTLKDIFSFTVDNNDNYWIASAEGLFVVSQDEKGEIKSERLFNEPEFQYCSFISLYKDKYGKIWAGTYGFGVFEINADDKTYANYTSKNGLSNDNVINISSGHMDDIWFSTLGGGASKFDLVNRTFDVISSDQGLPSGYVYSILIDSKERTWFATDGGGAVYIKDNEIHQPMAGIINTNSKIIYDVVEDKKHNIWLNCAENGVIKYTGDTFIIYNENNGLRTNSIRSITTDKEENIVLVSNEGIDIIDVETNAITYYGEDDGVAYLEPSLNAVYSDTTGKIWIGTASSIIRYNSAERTVSDVIPKIFIARKTVLKEDISEGKHVFKHNQNYLTFYYTGLWYKSAQNLSYRYMLEGYEMDWNAETNLRMVTYSNLPHGNYKFVVQVNPSGSEWISRPEAEYSFKIRPPFWKTIWFIVFVIIALTAGILLYIRIRIRNLQRAKDILEEEVKKRTHEIQMQKEEIEGQRDEIEAQRNFVIKQRDQIEKQNIDITASIQYASRIQRAVLPPAEMFNNYLGEHFIFYRPKDIVSGDFYYLNAMEDCVIIAAADCTGHGVPGAFMSMLGITLLNQIIVQLGKEITAGNILTLLRRNIKDSLRQTGKEGEAKDGMDIALCVLNQKDCKVQYAGAFNPLVQIRKSEVIMQKADRMPIGIFIREEEEFSNHCIDVQKGDMLYLYSDGFQDQQGGKQNKKFMAKNFRELLLNISKHPVNKQKELLESIFDKWKGESSQIDDVLVIGFRV